MLAKFSLLLLSDNDICCACLTVTEKIIQLLQHKISNYQFLVIQNFTQNIWKQHVWSQRVESKVWDSIEEVPHEKKRFISIALSCYHS